MVFHGYLWNKVTLLAEHILFVARERGQNIRQIRRAMCLFLEERIYCFFLEKSMVMFYYYKRVFQRVI